MKKTILILSIMTLFFAGCRKDDVFKEGDVFYNGIAPDIAPEEPIYPEDYPDYEYVVKNILLENYVGVKCVNCPAAGELALQLQEKYHHNVIVLGVHAGDLANFPLFNLKTPEGDAWWSQFNFQQNPIGTVNRKMINGGYAYDSPMWADAVAEALQEEAALEMSSAIVYNEATRKLKVDITSEFVAELPDTYSLTVCIMEDSIVGIQQTTEGMVNDYVHRHVFRTTMNGAWGEIINNTAIAPGDVITKSYTTTLDTAYNADQCYIIAYVSNSDTKEILQVIEKKIK
ncbi:MAG: Omp28 family outer membrane lipoprotein [Bacteroidales bacterium]|nr:Omp28 family outer membrane lipoprotein [Bacteroidales bacterium]